MKLFLEIFLFMGIFFPIYHVFNSLIGLNKKVNKSIHNKVTILIPCFNEEKILKTTIDGIIRLEYPDYEVFFINDGSSDNTLLTLKKLLNLKKTEIKNHHNLETKSIRGTYKSINYLNIYVIDKENGGKSDALNAGIDYSNNDYIVTLDADSVLKVDALSIIMSAFDDPNVVAASGVIQIMQSFILSKTKDLTDLKINTLLKLQTLEYIKACFSYKASLSKLRSLLVISGAFGCFTKDILLSINGFKYVIGEDLDLTVRIQLFIKDTNKTIAYVPKAICYTEGPENITDFIKQRKRWQQSFIESLINYYNKLYKDIFTRALSFFMFFDSLIIGVVSSFLVIIFFIIMLLNIIANNFYNVLAYLVIFISINLFYNLSSIFIASYYGIKYEGINKFRIIYTIFLDLFIYKFLTLYTVIVGTLTYFKNHKSWNKVERSGRNYDALKE